MGVLKMDISTKALQTLRMKNIYLENKRELVGQLNKEDKIFYSNWLLSQDEITSYDGVNELKGDLSFNSNSFEDGLEFNSNNHE
jgi:hypothetical protein